MGYEKDVLIILMSFNNENCVFVIVAASFKTQEDHQKQLELGGGMKHTRQVLFLQLVKM